jgi:hypothetical protein
MNEFQKDCGIVFNLILGTVIFMGGYLYANRDSTARIDELNEKYNRQQQEYNRELANYKRTITELESRQNTSIETIGRAGTDMEKEAGTIRDRAERILNVLAEVGTQKQNV